MKRVADLSSSVCVSAVGSADVSISEAGVSVGPTS